MLLKSDTAAPLKFALWPLLFIDYIVTELLYNADYEQRKVCAIKQQTKTSAAKISTLSFGSLARSPSGIGGAAGI